MTIKKEWDQLDEGQIYWSLAPSIKEQQTPTVGLECLLFTLFRSDVAAWISVAVKYTLAIARMLHYVVH